MTNLICHRSEKRSEANTPTDATKKLSFDSTGTKPGDPRPTELALATLFLTACVTPKEICTCIDERVKTDTRSLRVKSNISFKVPFNFQNSSVVVPVLFYRRCDFPDALSVTNLSGYDVSCLNLRETIQYIADVVYVCLPELKETCNENLSKRIRSFIEARYSLSDADIEDREKEYSDICEAMEKACGRDREFKARWQVVASFFELLVEGYPICLRCDTGSSKDWQLQYDEKHRLRYQASRARTVSVLLEYRIPLAYEKGRWPLKSKTAEKIRHHLARLFIKRPNTIYYGLGNADRTQSYHLQVAGPEGTFCSLAALKYSGPLEASDSEPLGTSTENTKKSPAEELAESVVRPFADIALSQKRCGQRHLWACVKDGSGFASWSLMYRHTPRLYNAYSISLIAAAVSAAMALICLFDFIHLSAPINFPYNSSSSLPAAFLAIVAPIAMAWIAKENRSARGLEIIPLLVIILVAASSLATIYNVFVTSNASREVLFWCCSLLTACALFLLVRIVVWTIIMWCLAKEEQPTGNLVAEEYPEEQRRRIELACSWSPGWRVLDCNNHIDKRFNRAKAEKKEKQYRQNRRYVRDAFLYLANRSQ